MYRIINKHLKDAVTPNWNIDTKTHNWRNYVNTIVRANWEEFSVECRCVIISICKEMADKEKWE